MVITPGQRVEFLELIALLIETVNEHQTAGYPICTGCWVCIRSRTAGDEGMVHEAVGSMSPESSEKRRAVSRLKVQMLEENASAETTYELRDPSRDRWGGGFTVDGDCDIAVSGFPEVWDLACGLYAANQVGLLPFDRVWYLAGRDPGAIECLRLLRRVHGPLKMG